MNRLILLLLPTALVAGCNTIGQSNFDCPITEKGAACISARQVYEQTHVSDRVAPNFIDGKPITPSSSGSAAPSPTAQQVASASYRPPLPEADAPLPVRTPAQVMRIRIFPWEDTAGDLQTGGFVFTEVRGRTWTIGEDQIARVQANVINPLAMPARSSTGPSINPVTSNAAPSMPPPRSQPGAAAPSQGRLPPSQPLSQPLPSTSIR